MHRVLRKSYLGCLGLLEQSCLLRSPAMGRKGLTPDCRVPRCWLVSAQWKCSLGTNDGWTYRCGSWRLLASWASLVQWSEGGCLPDSAQRKGESKLSDASSKSYSHPLTTASKPNYLPEAPSPNTITLALGLQHVSSEWEHKSLHNTLL